MFLALRVYFGVLTRRLEEDLTNEISVEEVFYELSKVEWIKGPEDKESFGQISNSAENIVDLFPEALPIV